MQEVMPYIASRISNITLGCTLDPLTRNLYAPGRSALLRLRRGYVPPKLPRAGHAVLGKPGTLQMQNVGVPPAATKML